MTTIDLDRRFVPWDDKDGSAIDAYAMSGWSRYSDDWPNLLKKRRVVILAEAGSGKTEELRERARLLTQAGQFAFYATVQDVGDDGLDGALRQADQVRLGDWRVSDQPAWFFVDSVDEARLDNIRLDRALRKLGDGIDVASRRAHVVLSSRITDWQSRADLKTFAELLPVPPERPAPGPPSPDEVLGQALRGDLRRDRRETSAETPVVAVMTPLDRERVRRFARMKGVVGVEEFMVALGDANLWSMASRPLDLDWLVTYWRDHGCLDSLAEMLDNNFQERLRETNPAHAQNDPIDTQRALQALERIGAAFVFGRTDKIAIPDPSIVGDEHSALDLAKILPDWSPERRRRLLTRPVFDPATFGRARLHNDNTGEVRAYLAARWLKRRREENCSVGDLLDLLFADSYGHQLIKPSVRQTAAWLAIWDNDVAREVLDREPLLLLASGDPASLPLVTRSAAVERAAQVLLAHGGRYILIDEDALRRFSTPDIAPRIRALWAKHKGNEHVRTLLLRMMWLGRLRECADLIPEALFGPYTDQLTLVFACRAATAIGGPAIVERYANKIRAEADRLPGWMFWEALDLLFPNVLSIPELLGMLRQIGPDVRDETLGLSYHGPRLAERITGPADLKLLLKGLLELLGPTDRMFGQEETPLEKAYYPFIAVIAHRLLDAVEVDHAPMIAIDAALRLGEGHRYRPSTEKARELRTALLSSRERRQAAFWRAAERFCKTPLLGGRDVQSMSDLDFAGWNPGLSTADADWLLDDAASRPAERQRLLACRVLMEIWESGGRDAALLSRIQERMNDQPALKTVCDLWLAPRELSEEERQSQEERARMRHEHNAREEERDRSWQEFVAKLQADPEILNRQPAPTHDHIDGHLYHLWILLRNSDRGGNRYGIDDLSPMQPMLGVPLTNAFRRALIAFWRQWTPTLPSAKPEDKRNTISNIDCMGLVGVSVEAKAISGWPGNISGAEARRAAEYATLEINGLPAWLEPLSTRFPNKVRDVLIAEIESDIENTAPRPRISSLEDVTRAGPAVLQCVGPSVFDLLAERDDFPQSSLAPTLTVVVRSHTRDADLVPLALSRFASASDLSVAAVYLAAAFRTDPDQALKALLDRLNGMPEAAQTALVQRVLPDLFDDTFHRRGSELPTLPFNVLTQLIETAFRTIRVEDDNRHDDGEAYTFDLRDSAEHARSYLFNQLCKTPGRASFEALGQLARLPGFPVLPERLQELAFNRAAEDAEHSPWKPGEAYGMEQEFDAAPNTPADLQSVAQRRLSDLQHSLHHDDFAQGRTLKMLPDERAVQNWVADQLRNRQGRAYSVEREPHVVDEKEPDIRIRARATDASLPIEIKVAESWALPQLEAALIEQLGARYLRAKDASHGILLLVHQNAREQGWRSGDGRWVTFEDVVQHLRTLANAQTAKSPDAPQALVAVLDVSDL
ncbi:MAG TPA: hypothetical protein VKI44_08625 [Acetobacteraceae bacterium]|nr:hypothetical protein [Acetobacteraceae bacterium]